MRWLLVLFLMLSLAACGGGDDGGGDDAGNDVTLAAASVTATVTTPPSPAATIAASPTGADSPLAVTTRQPGGAGIQPAASPDSGNPTPTRRPATVVTTPRPIAKTPTPRLSFPQATATPAEADDGVTVVVDELFDDAAATMFFTGETDYGVVAAIADGIYTLTLPEDAWQNIVAVDAGEFGNAAVLVEAGLQGEGAVGVIGRSMTNSDDTWTFYVCWLASDGRAGCHASISSEWTQLFAVEAGTIELLEVNNLYLSIVGNEIYFDVNDIEIGTINNSASSVGTWGVYAESFSGTSVAWYDRITIATIDE